MENKLEQLLNTLIQRGWKPFGVDRDNRKCIITYHNPLLDKQYFLISYFRDDIGRTGGEQFNIRELVSKSSGLWQFVCENGMIEKGGLFWELGYSSGEIDLESRVRRQDYEYRLIETALTDEDKLEQFLLDNIHIDE